MPIAYHVIAAREEFQPAARRSMTFAALIGASLLSGALTMARADTVTSLGTSGTNAAARLAQATPSRSTPGSTTGASANETRSETVEQRIATLHAELKITSDEEQKWDAVAKVMRENAENLDKLMAESHSTAPRSMTAVDDLEMYQKYAQAHVDGLKNLLSSFSTLYSAMPESQKKTADSVFETARQNAAAARGQTG